MGGIYFFSLFLSIKFDKSEFVTFELIQNGESKMANLSTKHHLPRNYTLGI